MLRNMTALAAAAILLAACASIQPLESKSAANTGAVDLSGDWTLRGAGEAPPRRFADVEQPFRIPGRNTQQQPRRSDGTAVSVFLENGQSVRISQTFYSLFISFDRAVVEEYTFGENRTVSVGPIEAQRVSGWEGDAFVTETQDTAGARLTESWSLADGGATLMRRVVLRRGATEVFSTEQLFDRD